MNNHTLSKDIFQFLEDVRQNNNREWFEKNKPRYKEARKLITSWANLLMEKLNQHDLIEEVKVFRIYRDIRFSKDKTPYKTNFGVGLTRATAARRGGCYVNIEPGNTFIGGGFWAPNKDDLLRIRKELDYDAQPLRKIIANPTFKKYFGLLDGEELKTAPRGFDKDHTAIDLLRKKQFLISRSFTDKQAMSHDFIDEADATFKAMRPFFDYMSEILTTDENGVSIL